MNYCDICLETIPDDHEFAVAGGKIMCDDCENWRIHWAGLTPEGRREEIRMMDAYSGDQG